MALDTQIQGLESTFASETPPGGGSRGSGARQHARTGATLLDERHSLCLGYLQSFPLLYFTLSPLRVRARQSEMVNITSVLLGLVLCALVAVLPLPIGAVILPDDEMLEQERLARDAEYLQDTMESMGEPVGQMEDTLESLNEGLEAICKDGKFPGPNVGGGYVPEANGCGPSGMQIPEQFGLYKCCNRHGRCGWCGVVWCGWAAWKSAISSSRRFPSRRVSPRLVSPRPLASPSLASRRLASHHCAPDLTACEHDSRPGKTFATPSVGRLTRIARKTSKSA